MAEVASANVTLIPKFQNLSSSISNALSSSQSSINATATAMGKSVSDSMGSGIKLGGVAGAVSSVVTSAMGVISSSVGSAISRVDTMANFPRVIESLGYSSDAAADAIQLMSDRINGLPTSLDSITSTTQRLLPITGSIESATAVSLALNDAMLAAGAGTADCERALTQYSQMLAKGKPELEDWRTLQEVMPGQLDQIAKAMIGPTAGSNDLYNALKDGTLTMDQFNDALVILDTEGYGAFSSFEEQARNSTKGIGTAITNVQNRVSKALAVIIEAIGSENIANAINKFSSTFVPIGEAIAGVIEKVKPVISSIIGWFKKLGTALSPITTAVKSLVNVFKTFANYTKTSVLVTLRQLKSEGGDSSEGFTKVTEAATKLAAKITALEQPVKEFFGHLTSVAVPVVKALAATFISVSDKIKAFTEKVSSSDKPLQTLATSLKTGIVGGVTSFATALQEKGPFGLLAETASSAAGTLSDVLAPGFTGASTKLAEFSTALAELASSDDPLGDLCAIIGESIQNALDSAKQKVMESEIFGPLIEKAEPVLTALSNLFAPIKEAGKTIFGTLGAAAQEAWGTISGAFAGFDSEVTDKVDGDALSGGNIFDTLAGAISQFQPLVDAVSSAVTIAVQSVSALANQALRIALEFVAPLMSAVSMARTQIVETLPDAFERITPAVSGVLTEVGNLLEGISEPVARVATKITELIAPVEQFLTDVVVAALGGIEAFIKNAAPGIESLADKIADFCDNVAPGLQTFLEGLVGILSPIAETVGTLAGSIASILASTAGEVLDEVGAVLGPTLEDWGEKFSAAGDTIGAACTDIQNGITGFTDALTQAIENDDYTALQTWWDDNIGGPISEAMSGFGAEVSGWWDSNITPAIDGIKSGWSSWWTERGAEVQGACDSIKATIDSWGISDAMASAWDGIALFLADPLGMCQSVFDTAVANINAAAEAWGITDALETAWSTVQSVIEEPLQAAQETLQNVIDTITGLFDSWGIGDTVTTAFSTVQAALEDPVQAAKDVITGLLGDITGAFSGMSFDWPSITLPHFSVDWGYFNDWWDFQFPSISVSWYARGGILDEPTLIGAGEAGPEAVVPLSNPYMRPFVDAIADGIEGKTGGDVYNFYIDGNAIAKDAELAAAFEQFGAAIKSAMRRGAIA
jgi:tape measure domain-containing protein